MYLPADFFDLLEEMKIFVCIFLGLISYESPEQLTDISNWYLKESTCVLMLLFMLRKSSCFKKMT